MGTNEHQKPNFCYFLPKKAGQDSPPKAFESFQVICIVGCSASKAWGGKNTHDVFHPCLTKKNSIWFDAFAFTLPAVLFQSLRLLIKLLNTKIWVGFGSTQVWFKSSSGLPNSSRIKFGLTRIRPNPFARSCWNLVNNYAHRLQVFLTALLSSLWCAMTGSTCSSQEFWQAGKLVNGFLCLYNMGNSQANDDKKDIVS